MKAGSSPVSEADYAVDRYLRETLLAARPGLWLAVGGDRGQRGAALRHAAPSWSIRSTARGAFSKARDLWCVSVAVVEDGRSVAGVLECPAREQTYWALPGQGAFQQWRAPHGARRPERGRASAGPKPMIDALPRALARRVWSASPTSRRLPIASP